MSALRGGLEQSCRHPRCADFAKLTQGGLFERLSLGEELLMSTAGGTTEEQTVKTGKERGWISHT